MEDLVNQEVISWSRPNYLKIINESVSNSNLQIRHFLRFPGGLILVARGKTNPGEALRLEVVFHVNASFTVKRQVHNNVQWPLEIYVFATSSIRAWDGHN
jgi:hypothetical protein